MAFDVIDFSWSITRIDKLAEENFKHKNCHSSLIGLLKFSSFFFYKSEPSDTRYVSEIKSVQAENIEPCWGNH